MPKLNKSFFLKGDVKLYNVLTNKVEKVLGMDGARYIRWNPNKVRMLRIGYSAIAVWLDIDRSNLLLLHCSELFAYVFIIFIGW